MTDDARQIRVVLIDDQEWVHEIVSRVLAADAAILLVGYGHNGADALPLCAQHQPDLILLDVRMPIMDGVSAAQQIHQHHPHIRVVALTSYQDDASVRAMLRQGAAGYILKSSLQDDLASTIRAAYRGMTVISQEVSQQLLRTDAAPRTDFGLTEREQEVLTLMAKGLNHAEIAAQLFISQSTVRFHLGNILEKLGVETRAEAIVVAARNNLI